MVLLLIGLCGAGYYGLMHSSMPLAWFERAIEESGDVEIEGLEGNISSGAEMKKLRFRDNNIIDKATGKSQWSELRDIKAKYKMGGFFSNEFSIEEISVGGGTIYADFDIDSDSGGDFIFSELQDELSDAGGEFTSSGGTFQVKLVRIADLAFVDSSSDSEFRIEEIRLEDVLFENNRLARFGELIVNADNIQLRTEESTKYPEADLAKRFVGKIEKGIINSVIADIPFEIEFGFIEGNGIASNVNWFDGKIRFESGRDSAPASYVINDFSPNQFFMPSESGVTPEAIQLEAKYDPKKTRQLMSVESSGSFVLGQTKFSNFLMPEPSDSKPDIRMFLATADVGGTSVTARVYVLSKLPLLGIQLDKVGDWSIADTWSHVVFGQPYADLSIDQQAQLDKNVELAKRKFSNRPEGRSSSSGRKKSDIENSEDESDLNGKDDAAKTVDETDASASHKNDDKF